ncbi:hypothetical protein AA0112_g9756 [Alternaria arborescens]|uniref:hypothetical protein n=1 Tax=Alternaria arborescens TaxID=156630 RepID=UPI00107550DC|nr:hypothetical protein AA0111_g7018 [Alternaria arborescens]RYN22526.1 hypothetical protein AA0112_g9756 [Alternaria arborescens]RYO28051.1 hypothetical protein AA0111_g7018 [Alternaria arborescens]
MVECWLEYESLDRIVEWRKKALARSALTKHLADMLLAGAEEILPDDDGTGSRVAEALKKTMFEAMDAELDEDVELPIHSTRKRMLEMIYEATQTMRADMEAPGVLFTESATTAETWLKTFIWAPLSDNEVHPEKDQGGYFALSYVWSDTKLSMQFLDEEISNLLRTSQAGGKNLDQVLSDVKLPEDMSFLKPQRSNRPIKLNGSIIQVGPNLESALRSLREIPEVQNGKRVWIDSLCINQKDIEEKSYEVKRMRDIYSHADRVVSWLGEDTEHAGRVIEMMNTIGGSILTEQDCSRISDWFFSFIESEMGVYIAKFLAHPYWSRIWIVQEIVLGSEKSITICGARRFPTINILRFASRILNDTDVRAFNTHRILYTPTNSYSDAVSVGRLSAGLRKLSDLCTLQKNLELLTSESGTSTLWFRTASNNFATDPRDLLYGMMSLLPRDLVSLINVDYSPGNTYKDVMIDFATAQIHSTRDISWILHRPWSPFPGWQDWPSWVPNLSIPFSYAHFMWNYGTYALQDSKDCESYTTRRVGNHATLTCSGFFIDTVKQSAKSFAAKRCEESQYLIMRPWLLDEIAAEIGVDEWEFRKHTRSTIHEFPEHEPSPELILTIRPYHRYGNVQGLRNAVSECFKRLRLTPHHEDESMFDIPLDVIENAAAPALPGLTVDPPVPYLLQQLLGLFSEIDLWDMTFRDLFLQHGSGRPIPHLRLQDRTALLGRIFTTCTGYLGAALSNVCRGDRVYLLKGCLMPVVLRPSSRLEGAYELVGGVCVPGIMHKKESELVAEGMVPETVMLV